MVYYFDVKSTEINLTSLAIGFCDFNSPFSSYSNIAPMGLVSSVAVITVTDATEHSELNASPLNPNEPILVKSSNASSFEVQFFRPIQLGYTLRVIVYVYFFVSIYSGNSEAASK